MYDAARLWSVGACAEFAVTKLGAEVTIQAAHGLYVRSAVPLPGRDRATTPRRSTSTCGGRPGPCLMTWLATTSCCGVWLVAGCCTAQPSPARGITCGSIAASFVLALRGHTVLHASAVETPAGAVAITGPSGFGQVDDRALACAGVSLITDDVLWVHLSSDLGSTVTRGADDIRLYPA
jgi:hypothetical protein